MRNTLLSTMFMLFPLLTCAQLLATYLGYHIVLGMDSNNDVHDGAVSAALTDIGIEEAVINNHRGESVSVTSSKNKQQKPIDSIWSSPGLEVLHCDFLSFPSIVCMVLTQTINLFGLRSVTSLCLVTVPNKFSSSCFPD